MAVRQPSQGCGNRGRLELRLELVPTAATLGVLANLNNPITGPQLTELQSAVHALGHEMQVLNAGTESDFETAFAAVDQHHVDALLVAADPFFDDRRTQIDALAARHRVPVSYVRREFATAGGLLRPRQYRRISSGRALHRPYPQGREAFRPTSIAADQIRAGHQPEDRQSAR